MKDDNISLLLCCIHYCRCIIWNIVRVHLYSSAIAQVHKVKISRSELRAEAALKPSSYDPLRTGTHNFIASFPQTPIYFP